MKKKWIPVGEEEITETDKYKYVMGYYNHEEWGDGCFRVSKFLKENNYFIGHFVIVPEDFDEITEKMITMMKKGILI
jgi:hypothetical protein